MTLAKETLYKYTTEEKTYGADFGNEGALKSGETIVSGTVEVQPTTGSPPTATAAEVITETFKDSDGRVIQAGRGLKSRLSGGDAAARTVVFTAVTSGGDVLVLPGRLIVENPSS